MHEVLYHNDRFARLSEAQLSPGQAGLFNGWGIFTTLLIHEGRPFAYHRHWQRLTRDASRTDVELPVGQEEVRRVLDDLIEANAVGQGLARLYFIHNRAGMWKHEGNLPAVDFLACTSELNRYRIPAVLGIAPNGRHAGHPLSGTKVTSWLGNAWLLAQAHKRGVDEVVLLNEHGHVAECTSANIFRRVGDRIETPPLSSGCLAGVTREVLLDLAPAIGLAIRESVLRRADLLEADEVFITSTSRGVLPVGRIEERRLPVVDGPSVRRLGDAFQDYLRRCCGSGASATAG